MVVIRPPPHPSSYFQKSTLYWSRSSPCFAATCGSVKWLYLEEPRVGWARSLPLPGLSNTTPTTISVAFYALYGAYITFLSWEETRIGGWKPDFVRCEGWEWFGTRINGYEQLFIFNASFWLWLTRRESERGGGVYHGRSGRQRHHS